MRDILKLTAPIGLAFVPLGIALGFLVVHGGLSWWWSPVFAAVIYAGSLEFLMVAMAATAAPIATVALTTVIVNSRHVFYALSFPLHRVEGLRSKLYSTYVLSDEAFAVAVSPEARSWTSRQIMAMQGVLHLTWMVSAGLGGLIGSMLPIDRLKGLDFALTALFRVLSIDAYRQHPDRFTAVTAVVCAVLAWLIVPDQTLVCAFAGFTAVMLIRKRLTAPRSRS